MDVQSEIENQPDDGLCYNKTIVIHSLFVLSIIILGKSIKQNSNKPLPEEHIQYAEVETIKYLDEDFDE